MSRLWLMLVKRRFLGRPQFTTPTDLNTPSSSPTPTIESHAPTKSSSTADPTDQILRGNPDGSDASSPATTPTTTDWNTWNAPADTQAVTSPSTSTSETTTSTTAEGTTKTENDSGSWTNTTTSTSQETATTTSTSSSSSTTTTTITPSVAAKSSHPAPSEDGTYSGIGSSQTKLAIAIPIAIVGVLVIIGLIWFCLRRRRQQRYAQPTFNMATSQRTAVSTSDLMGIPKIATPEPSVSSRPHAPILIVPREQRHKQSYSPSPASASARSPDHLNTELGIAVAVPVNPRMSVTEHDPRGFGRSASTAGTGAAGVRLPFQSTHAGDDDALSVISDLNERRDGEHDLDDLSSVSSFNDDHPGHDHHGRTGR